MLGELPCVQSNVCMLHEMSKRKIPKYMTIDPVQSPVAYFLDIGLTVITDQKIVQIVANETADNLSCSSSILNIYSLIFSKRKELRENLIRDHPTPLVYP